MFERLKKRYSMGWIRDDQLERYVALGILTQDQAREIAGSRNEEV